MPPGVTNKSGARITTDYVVPTNVPIGEHLSSGGAPGTPQYAAPTAGNTQYVFSPVSAWSALLRSFPGGVPDPGRNKTLPLREYGPDGGQPPAEWYLGQNGPGRVEQTQHTALEHVDADGWQRFQPVKGTKRAAPDPRRSPPTPERVTDGLSPSSYTFSRQFDQRFAHRLTGQHFSMADHRRNYPILGMAPTPFRRNTYRIDPAPWDTHIVDYDPVSAPQPGRIVSHDITGAVHSSYRLT